MVFDIIPNFLSSFDLIFKGLFKRGFMLGEQYPSSKLNEPDCILNDNNKLNPYSINGLFSEL